MIRRIGHAPNADQRYVLRPGSYAILPLRGSLLLTAQLTDIVDVQLPGGGIDPGESPIQALHREVLEETGWRIAKPRRLGAFRRFVYMPEYNIWAEKLCHIYAARPVRQITMPIEPNHETLIVSPEEAVQIMGNNGDRHFVANYYNL